jgi:hypothetical protein
MAGGKYKRILELLVVRERKEVILKQFVIAAVTAKTQRS